MRILNFEVRNSSDNMAERAFMVRAGNDNELVDEFESRSLVAIGWEELGDVSDVQSYEEMKARFNSTDEYSEHNSRRLAQNAGQVNRFALEMEEEHLVLSYDKTEREYLIGTVTAATSGNRVTIRLNTHTSGVSTGTILFPAMSLRPRQRTHSGAR